MVKARRQTCDLAVVGSTPGQAVIGLPICLLSLPSLGVGKSSTGLSGWGYGGARSLVSDGR